MMILRGWVDCGDFSWGLAGCNFPEYERGQAAGGGDAAGDQRRAGQTKWTHGNLLFINMIEAAVGARG
jgi:hypothetical protein